MPGPSRTPWKATRKIDRAILPFILDAETTVPLRPHGFYDHLRLKSPFESCPLALLFKGKHYGYQDHNFPNMAT
jgi:hypothetical protein